MTIIPFMLRLLVALLLMFVAHRDGAALAQTPTPSAGPSPTPTELFPTCCQSATSCRDPRLGGGILCQPGGEMSFGFPYVCNEGTGQCELPTETATPTSGGTNEAAGDGCSTGKRRHDGWALLLPFPPFLVWRAARKRQGRAAPLRAAERLRQAARWRLGCGV